MLQYINNKNKEVTKMEVAYKTGKDLVDSMNEAEEIVTPEEIMEKLRSLKKFKALKHNKKIKMFIEKMKSTDEFEIETILECACYYFNVKMPWLKFSHENNCL